MKKLLVLVLTLTLAFGMVGCEEGENNLEGEGTVSDILAQFELQNTLSTNQPTPTEFEYSLERYNLIKRAYWINGQRDIANSLALPVSDMPIGYVALFAYDGTMIAAHAVVGKVSSLNSYLTKDTHCEVIDRNDGDVILCRSLADVDGSYGVNDNGIFFFNTYGEYIEWNGTYYYSDYAFDVPNTAINRMGIE